MYHGRQRAKPGDLIYLTIARDAGVWGAMQGSMERFKKEGIRPRHRRRLRNPGVRTVGEARKATVRTKTSASSGWALLTRNSTEAGSVIISMA